MEVTIAPPSSKLGAIASKDGLDLYSEQFAEFMDRNDPLASYRKRFCYPKKKTLSGVDKDLPKEVLEEECVYLCGNSLGLKPTTADSYVIKQLDKWAEKAVDMHFEEPLPAAACDRYGREAMGRLVGAEPSSVTLMNGLTVNLHLLMISFYRPTPQRYKILIEGHAFPSDRYAMVSQLEMRGYTKDALIQLTPRDGEHCLRHDDIMQVLEKEGSSIAVVCLSGVQYYTGQKFNMEKITAFAQRQGCYVGWDLAHAIGNVELKLDEWGVDFACWCTYKYLNSGPGCIAGAYVNSKHNDRKGQLHGWWSNKEETRFQMAETCDVAPGIDGFRLCNPPPILVSLVMASLEIFDEAGMPALLKKQKLLTGYLELLLTKYFEEDSPERRLPSAKIVTPTNTEERGCQLSLEFSLSLKEVQTELGKRGVVCDIRTPNVMRLGPAPLYNSFKDIYNFVNILREVFRELALQSPGA